MPPPISWADLAGRRVGLWGLGAEGSASLRRLRSIGLDADVLVDDRPAAGSGERVVATGEGGFDALARCDVVVKSPGVSRLRPEVAALEAAGVAVVGGLGLWLASVDRDRVICVTGTKGKSTTTAVAAHLATGLGLRVFAGGNLGEPPYDPAAVADPGAVDLWVIETSSYQATDAAVAPPVVAVTSLFPDHLPWHGDLEAYYADKLSLCTRPGARVTVASAVSPELRAHAALLGPEVIWVGDDGGAWVDTLGLVGVHNRVNAAIARAALVAAGVRGADDDAAVAAAAAGFTALESRLEHAGEVDGVEFVDDSLSTNVGPTVAALDAFAGRRVALIAGGFDRDIDYGPLATALAARAAGGAETLVLTVYDTGPRIRDAVEPVAGPRLVVEPCADLADAVGRGFRWARPDGVVLLSPAAASFDAFDDYRHRARAFRDAIGALDPR